MTAAARAALTAAAAVVATVVLAGVLLAAGYAALVAWDASGAPNSPGAGVERTAGEPAAPTPARTHRNGVPGDQLPAPDRDGLLP